MNNFELELNVVKGICHFLEKEIDNCQYNGKIIKWQDPFRDNSWNNDTIVEIICNDGNYELIHTWSDHGDSTNTKKHLINTKFKNLNFLNAYFNLLFETFDRHPKYSYTRDVYIEIALQNFLIQLHGC